MTDTDADLSDHENLIESVRAAVHSHGSEVPAHEPAQQPSEGHDDLTQQVQAMLEQQPEQRSQQRRDGKGRFASTAAEPAQPSGPPTSWSPQAKAAWEAALPELREAVTLREQQMASGRDQWAGEQQRLRDIEAALAPRREYYTQKMGFKSDAEAINQLFNLADHLGRDPAGTIRWLAQANGVDLNSLVTGQQGGISHEVVSQVVQREVQAALTQAGQQVEAYIAQQVQERVQTAMTQAEQQRLAHERAGRKLQASRASISGAPYGAASNVIRKSGNGHFGEVADEVRAALAALR